MSPSVHNTTLQSPATQVPLAPPLPTGLQLQPWGPGSDVGYHGLSVIVIAPTWTSGVRTQGKGGRGIIIMGGEAFPLSITPGPAKNLTRKAPKIMNTNGTTRSAESQTDKISRTSTTRIMKDQVSRPYLHLAAVSSITNSQSTAQKKSDPITANVAIAQSHHDSKPVHNHQSPNEARPDDSTPGPKLYNPNGRAFLLVPELLRLLSPSSQLYANYAFYLRTHSDVTSQIQLQEPHIFQRHDLFPLP